LALTRLRDGCYGQVNPCLLRDVLSAARLASATEALVDRTSPTLRDTGGNGADLKGSSAPPPVTLFPYKQILVAWGLNLQVCHLMLTAAAAESLGSK